MTVAEDIEAKLRRGLDPDLIEVVDESYLHAGHAGAPAGGESHFRVRIVATAFDGESRVARQRRVTALLREELATKVHALSIKAETPGEASGNIGGI